ncbi:MAG: hypothetical protein IMW91_02395 [Firmicutes bacterium]|nr:hypothetical protein [Bacillota bacterium]
MDEREKILKEVAKQIYTQWATQIYTERDEQLDVSISVDGLGRVTAVHLPVMISPSQRPLLEGAVQRLFNQALTRLREETMSNLPGIKTLIKFFGGG